MSVFEKLRAKHGAVAPVRVTGDLPAWLVLGYREILDVVRTPSRFSHDSRIWNQLKEGRVPPDSPVLPVIGWRPDCLSADGEEHRRLRDAITESLGRFDRRGVRRHVTRFSNQLIDEFAPDGHAELLDQFAQQLPMIVLTQLLGMPEEYGPRMVEAATELVKGSEKAVSSNEYIRDVLGKLVTRKHSAPGPDLASWLISHPSQLSDDEILNHLWLVLIAANENTTSLMASTLRMVLTDERFRASLTGGHMTLPDAVEQVLWDEPPTIILPARWATGDTEIADLSIKAGDMLLLGLAAGNVDSEVRPDLSTPMHGNRSHLSFGGGPHECPGRDIARAIADTAIDTLLMRLPDLQLSVPESELRWRSSTWTRHLVSLPVKFDRRRPDSETASGISQQNPQTSLPHSVPEDSSLKETATATSTPAITERETGLSWWNSMKRWWRGR
ncbi:cytochrome P450 [Streptomyces gobiensis]|uniref:cytochrome P450 n=1 Tax=Streptomyces gobiensis TaxID=2875706 RepID=UPI001E56842C|nr:cytochrome P450 [Streptomyces gobiensis]UGY94500.1 cytochrome P450 [Streptomyces gobiensis]